MEVVQARSALLSNFEVRSLLQELENEHIVRTKTAVRIKKEEEVNGVNSSIRPEGVEISENLRTIEVEAIQYLSADFQPTTHQTAESITELVKGLSKYKLTKAEKLQVVNLAPTLPVELYVIVEELEDRLGSSMEDVLDLVRHSLVAQQTSLSSNPELETPATMLQPDTHVGVSSWEDGEDLYEQEFEDHGEGAGVEGDLDMEDE